MSTGDEDMLLFWEVMLAVFVAEMGDKTQLILIAMTSKFKLKDIIIGTAAAILILNALAVAAGGLIGSLIPQYIIKAAAAIAFMFFSVTSIKTSDDTEEKLTNSRFKLAPVAVFSTFFLAELGDKTQLTAMTFGANSGLESAVIVWLACSVGLFAADIIGLLVGYLLKSRLPENFLNMLAFAIFAVFGVVTMHEALSLIPGLSGDLRIPLLIAITAVFAAVCAGFFIRKYKKHRK